MNAQNMEMQTPLELFWRTSWDFFSGASGSKTGYATDLKDTGCVLKTNETIDFRRWIRMIIRDGKTNVSFTAVGRVVRCEYAFETSLGAEATLYRYAVEFTYPVDATSLVQPVKMHTGFEPDLAGLSDSRLSSA